MVTDAIFNQHPCAIEGMKSHIRWAHTPTHMATSLENLSLLYGSRVNSAQNQLGPNQVGPKPIRPKTKSAQNQVGPKPTRPKNHSALDYEILSLSSSLFFFFFFFFLFLPSFVLCTGNLFHLRGYCTPGQFLDCFCIFLENYNTLVTSKICFL